MSGFGPESTPSPTILDAAHGGSPGFYFLAPLVSAPAYTGTFDATRSPVITVCALAGSACGATMASFSSAQVKVDLAEEAYRASWKTKGAGLDPTKTYRIQVVVGTTVLGYADVVVLINGSQIKTVDRDQYVAVINGGALNIRFRIDSAPPPPPPPATEGWKPGDLVTYHQQEWGSIGTTAAILLATHMATMYPNGIEIGVPGATGNSALFTTLQSVLSFLPIAHTPGPLDNDYLDPSTTSAGSFAGYALALRLDVDFGDAGYLQGNAGVPFGDLRVCGLTGTTLLNGLTVRQLSATMAQALGGGGSVYTFDALAALAQELTQSFESGAPTQWAQRHLVNGSC